MDFKSILLLLVKFDLELLPQTKSYEFYKKRILSQRKQFYKPTNRLIYEKGIKSVIESFIFPAVPDLRRKKKLNLDP